MYVLHLSLRLSGGEREKTRPLQEQHRVQTFQKNGLQKISTLKPSTRLQLERLSFSREREEILDPKQSETTIVVLHVFDVSGLDCAWSASCAWRDRVLTCLEVMSRLLRCPHPDSKVRLSSRCLSEQNSEMRLMRGQSTRRDNIHYRAGAPSFGARRM